MNEHLSTSLKTSLFALAMIGESLLQSIYSPENSL